jgi:hypothetical protein
VNLLELKRAVDHAVSRADNPEDVNVCIMTYKVGSVGHVPFTDVGSANLGFDWEKGSFLINPKTTLREIDKDEIAEIRDKYDELGWSYYKISKIKRENEALKKQVEELTKGTE